MTTEGQRWTVENFNRRKYTIEGTDLDDAKRIQVTIQLDGKTIAQMQAREPGILAIVSRPEEQGFDIEIVEVGGVRYTDYSVPVGQQKSAVANWQREALNL